MVSSTSEAVGDYLKAILELSGPMGGRVTSNALAERLGVRPASVTGMLQKLARQRPLLVHYEKRRGVRLTVEGERLAWEIVRHHRLLELFLHDILQYSWDEVHEEAERLEHFISERFEDRVAAILGDPRIDPHGHVIPQRHGAALFAEETPLLDWTPGVPAIVNSVGDRDPAALRELARLELLPGAALVVDRVNPNASLLVRILGRKTQFRLSNELAAHVSVAASPSHSSGGLAKR